LNLEKPSHAGQTEHTDTATFTFSPYLEWNAVTNPPTHTHTHTGFPCFMRTSHRHNDFNSIQTYPLPLH